MAETATQRSSVLLWGSPFGDSSNVEEQASQLPPVSGKKVSGIFFARSISPRKGHDQPADCGCLRQGRNTHRMPRPGSRAYQNAAPTIGRIDNRALVHDYRHLLNSGCRRLAFPAVHALRRRWTPDRRLQRKRWAAQLETACLPRRPRRPRRGQTHPQGDPARRFRMRQTISRRPQLLKTLEGLGVGSGGRSHGRIET